MNVEFMELHCASLGFRKSRQEPDAHSEKDLISHGDHDSSAGLAPVTKPHDVPNQSLISTFSSRSSSAGRGSNKRNYSTSQRSRRITSLTPGSSPKSSTASVLGSRSSSVPDEESRSSEERVSRPVVHTRVGPKVRPGSVYWRWDVEMSSHKSEKDSIEFACY